MPIKQFTLKNSENFW